LPSHPSVSQLTSLPDSRNAGDHVTRFQHISRRHPRHHPHFVPTPRLRFDHAAHLGGCPDQR
jgi:hypothetical protein